MPSSSGLTDLGYKIEWLEGPKVEKEKKEPPKREGPKVRVARIMRCPDCGWMEAETAGECYRCGAELESDIRQDPTLQRLGIAMEGPQVKATGVEEKPTQVQGNLDGQGYLMRLRAERLQLVQGFDELMSLDEVEVNHYEYQLEACKTVLSRMRGRALLADEVGLGKTIEAGLVMKELIMRRMVRRVLVLTPAPLVYQWRDELEAKFGESFTIVEDEAQWEVLREDPDARVVMSLPRAKGKYHAPHIHASPWDLVIIDEAHRLKNRSTVAYKFVKGIERRYMLMLTATPVHNDLTELFSIIDLLKPGQLGTLSSFKEQFVKSGDTRSPANAPALQQLLSDVMIRNRRAEVGIIFPKRQAAIMHVELPELERQLYDDMSGFIRQALHEVDSGQKRNHLRLGLMTLQRELCSSPAAVAYTLRNMAGEEKSIDDELKKQFIHFAEQAEAIGYAAKVDALLDLLDTYEGKFLVFTEFRRSQDELLKALKESGIHAVPFHGGLRAIDKEKSVDKFRKEARVLVSTESGGEGRNLQFCHQLVNYDLPWNPMRVEQRIGRVHRLGQEHDVSVFNLSTTNTLEAYLLDLLAKKIRMFELVVGELDLILGESDKGEATSFEAMLRDAWMNSEDEVDLQVSIDQIGDKFKQSRGRYLDTRLLNEEMFESLSSADEIDA